MMARRSRVNQQFTLLFTLFALISILVAPGESVKHENFKTCSQSGFCKRNRAYADEVSNRASVWKSPYNLETTSILLKDGLLQATIIKTTSTKEKVRLPLTVSFLESGVARVIVDEERRIKGDIELRHESKARKERYNEAAKWALVGGLELSKSPSIHSQTEAGLTIVQYGPNKRFEAIIRHSPFEIEFRRDGETHIKFNDRGLFNLEHWRPKTEEEDNKLEGDDDQSTWWDESFGGNTDSKPRGPESVGLDISFLGYENVYGIPEHADSLTLKETRGGTGNHNEPYRLYNSDVFEYELNNPMTLYGSIPFMQAHRKNSTVGVFWLNAAETWVDIVKAKSTTNPLSLGLTGKQTTQTHWFSETGQLDVFVFLGPTAQDVLTKYGELTGFTQLPQQFAIAYHQCRWNYVTDEDVKEVDRRFDRYQIPYDVIWLDIEYTDGKKYFTWDPMNFPNPEGMQQQLAESDRKLVFIIDPHIKNVNEYHIVEELKSKDLAVKNKDGNIYDGWCWPGSSHWVDTFNPAATSWWKELFRYDRFKGTLSNSFLWNDMNEPSVFNGPETTMPKDNLHYGNWEHRDVHNINGMTFVNASYQGMLERKKGEIRRPFILTRSFFSGTQRMAAMWTGDNLASWGHLAASIPMVLSNGISGFPFSGADVGGFFGNPSKELLTRWYQTGIFYPFFRAHAHIDTRRREPYLAGQPYLDIITDAIRLRYQLLPAWYTAFHRASVDGSPIIKPMYYVHPDDESGFGIDDQFYVGDTGLLAKPVVTEDATSSEIYLSDDEKYYDYFDYTIYQGSGKKHTIPAPLEKIPLLMRGGHIIPRKDRPRRSSSLMKWDPYTLLIVLDENGQAEGSLYVDDGETFDFQKGAYIHRFFRFSDSKLTSENLGIDGPKTREYFKAMSTVRVDKVIIVGAPSEWKTKTQVQLLGDGVNGASTAPLQFHPSKTGRTGAYAVIKNPGLSIGKTWTVQF